MNELLAALAKRTQTVAEPYAAGYADSNRLFCVRLTRPSIEPGFDRRTGAFQSQPQQLVFEGAARVRPVSPSQQIELGDGPTYWNDVEISIALMTVSEPRVDDIATILEAPPGGDLARLRFKTFRVTGVGTGGHLAIGFALTCTGVQPSRYSTDPQDGGEGGDPPGLIDDPGDEPNPALRLLPQDWEEIYLPQLIDENLGVWPG